MNKYQQGKIYRIVSDSVDNVYIGSTTQELNERFREHLSDYGQWIDDKGPYMSSFITISEGDAKIELIESYPCTSKYDLRQREQFYLDAHKNICVNQVNSFGLNKEKRDTSNKKHQQSEKYKASVKKYHQSEKYKSYNKIYKQSETYKAYTKKRDAIRPPIFCECCGDSYGSKFYARHKKSIKHQDNEKFFNDLLNQ